MRTSVYIATSLDGFIAREDGNLDWLMDADAGDGDYGFAEFVDSIDALVMGRNTFDFVAGTGEWAYGDKPLFVMTTRDLDLTDGFPGRVQTVGSSPQAVLADLESRGMEHVYVDGGATIQAFMREGLVNRMIITRLPILIGSGISLFGAVDADVALELVGSRAFENAWIQDEYRVIS